MRLIDGDALLRNIRRAVYPSDLNTTIAVGICESHVKDMPTIDAVLVVRCKDCRYAPINLGAVCSPENIKWRDARYFAGEDSEACPYNCGDPWYSVMPEPHWYCWKGKRKEQ